MAEQDLNTIAFPVLNEAQIVQLGLFAGAPPQWTLKRQPFLLETSRPGVFAGGDVRSGSVKRVASAVGKGSNALSFVHQRSNEYGKR